jgi:anti-sigma B factor antagonist
MKALQLASEHANDSVVITVAGELDLATRPELCAYVHHILDIHSDTVIIDLAEVTFIDACGLSALIILRRHAHDLGTSLLLAEVPPVVLKLLKLTGLESSFVVISHVGAVGRRRLKSRDQERPSRPEPAQAGAPRTGR